MPQPTEPTEEHLRQLDAGPKSLEDKELYAAQRRLDAGPPHPDAASPREPIPPIHPPPGAHPSDIGPELLQAYRERKAPSKGIPKDHIQQNCELVPVAVRRELYDLVELLVDHAWYQDDELQIFERKARALVDKVLGVGIEHYRRLTSAADEHFIELDRQRDELLQGPELWGKSVFEDLPEDEARWVAEIDRRVAEAQRRLARESKVALEEVASKKTLGACRVCGRPAAGICGGEDCGLPVCADCGLRCPHELGGASKK